MSAVSLQPVLIEEVIAMSKSNSDYKMIFKFHGHFLIKTLFIRYWYPFVTAEYGNCFSFNSHYNKDDPDLFASRQRLATLTGTSNGLTVEVFLDQKNYMLEKLSKKAGARLIIHDAYSPPLADEYGMDLQPNTASSVAIQQVKNFYIILLCIGIGRCWKTF